MQPNMPSSINMSTSGKSGNGKLIVIVILTLGLVGSLIFGFWSFAGMQDYKNNVDKKIADASVIVKQQTSTEKDKEFAEKEKSPLKHFTGPETYGKVDLEYPKTWSSYLLQDDSGSAPLDTYFHPDYVPGLELEVAYALRLRVINKSYETQLKTYESKVKNGKVAVSPFRAAKVTGVLGSRIVGEVNTGQKDILVMLPVRDKTLEIWTEAEQYHGDFDNIILPSLSFSP